MHSSMRNESVTEKFIWTITNFSRLPQIKETTLKSSIIHQRHARKVWRFVLLSPCEFDENYMVVFFAKAYLIFDPILYNCSLSVGGLNSNPVDSSKFKSIDFETRSIVNKCLRKDYIEKPRKETLKIQCEITEASEKSYFSSIVTDFENLSLDLTMLYKIPVYSDLTVHVQQQKFFLHTCVLYARARRLSHLFGYQSFNRMPNMVQMNDISPNQFHLLMTYLYSGKLGGAYVPLDLFMLADKLKLQSVKQLVYEKVQEYHTETEIATQALTITWNLKEIKIREEGSLPLVQIFKAGCCMSHLIVRMGISKLPNGEKFMNVSFMVTLNIKHVPVSLSCVMMVSSNGKHCAHKKANYIMEPYKQWHFPPFIKLSDISESIDFDSDISLTAEVTLSDGCSEYNTFHTKSRLLTQNELLIYSERLGSDMGRLLASNVEARFKKSDVYLKSSDNHYIPAHKAILYARWPEIRKYLMNHNEAASYLQLNLKCAEIEMLLDYIYTGSLKYFNHLSAEKVLRANAKEECPRYLVKKCEYFLYGIPYFQ